MDVGVDIARRRGDEQGPLHFIFSLSPVGINCYVETDSVLHLETKQDSSVVLSLVRVHCSSFSSSSIKPPLGGLVCSTTSTTSRGERERGTRGRVGPTRENLVVGERGRDTWFPCPRGPLWNPLKLCIVELFPAPPPHRHFFVEW